MILLTMQHIITVYISTLCLSEHKMCAGKLNIAPQLAFLSISRSEKRSYLLFNNQI